MRNLLFAVSICCLAMACGGSSPEKTVQQFFDAVQAGDGETAASLISRGSIDEMSASLEEIRNDASGEQLSALCVMLGIEVDPEEFAELDAEGLAALVLGSEMIRGEFPETYEVLSTEIEGDRALLNVRGTVDGETDEQELELVREDGVWKLDMENM